MAFFCCNKLVDDDCHVATTNERFNSFSSPLKTLNFQSKISARGSLYVNSISSCARYYMNSGCEWLIGSSTQQAFHSLLVYLSLASTNLQSVLIRAKNGKKELYLLFYFNLISESVSHLICNHFICKNIE